MSLSDPKSHAKDALVKAAKELFIEKGYDAVSTRELAEAAGVNLGAIQYHFGSKANLFAETVRTLMQGSSCVDAHAALDGELRDQQDAANKLAQFVITFLDNLLHPDGPQPCRMMFREIFTSTCRDKELFEVLTTTMVSDFIKPADALLCRIVEKLNPKLTQEQVEHSTQSVIGQCFFYLTNGPFVGKLRGFDYADEPHFKKTATHIVEFSLRALGCGEATIATAKEEGFESWQGEMESRKRGSDAKTK